MSKYNNWYNSITTNAKSRILGEYSEKHHIIPKSLDGTDDPFNIVSLTAREHFICHWLLVKMHTGEARYKMLNALRMMRAENPNQQRYTTKITARVYANLKEEYSEIQSIKHKGSGNGFYGKNHTEEATERIRLANIGNKITTEQRLKISQSKLGKSREKFSEAWRAKLSQAKQGSNNNMFGKFHSAETKQKISEKAKGRKQSPETIAKKIAGQLGKTRPKKLCPNCNELIAVNTYPRWHGDNCKSK